VISDEDAIAMLQHKVKMGEIYRHQLEDELREARAALDKADRFLYLRKTSHDGDEIQAALEDYYAVRAAVRKGEGT
jgi:hypothetical protein